MIVSNNGYLKLEDVLKLKTFAIYETQKKTHILFTDEYSHYDEREEFCFPRQDKLEWKLEEGKVVCHGPKVFDSRYNSIDSIDATKWNNGNQIMSYVRYEWNY